ncbi:hypothetical protein CFP65_7518 [Kitasatospora sp. MMS16-BH015]|uniref:hypothetical protein n=1 Tax=Kitasatospora sp. MMS16-BH015 TaxID=2018025 RepID=UPI000CA3E0D5|nr:hypothetical protein [Kitasatospora sp. MMS16-BH015]AUG82094.1 hypothetical protein CFP65_7518 [Kitasatospora sp. MMS16-BH015]
MSDQNAGSAMAGRLGGKETRDMEDIRAADPEEGVTSAQTAHAFEHDAAEGPRADDQGQPSDGAR